MRGLFTALALMLPALGCEPNHDRARCAKESEAYMELKCAQDSGGDACPGHERYAENRMILIYNCESGS